MYFFKTMHIEKKTEEKNCLLRVNESKCLRAFSFVIFFGKTQGAVKAYKGNIYYSIKDV